MEGRKQKAREGKWNGGQAPFGYTLDKENSILKINPEAAEIVKLIFHKYVRENMGTMTISNYLNKRGYEKQKGKSRDLTYFTQNFIRGVLDNPVYVGKIAYGKNTIEKIKGTRDQYHRIKVDDYILCDGLHEVIIDEELWEEAKEKRKRMSGRTEKIHSLGHEYLLTGIIKCLICGNGLIGSLSRKKVSVKSYAYL